MNKKKNSTIKETFALAVQNHQKNIKNLILKITTLLKNYLHFQQNQFAYIFCSCWNSLNEQSKSTNSLTLNLLKPRRRSIRKNIVVSQCRQPIVHRVSKWAEIVYMQRIFNAFWSCRHQPPMAETAGPRYKSPQFLP